MIRTLHHDRWFRVDLEPNDALYRVARSAAPFPDAATSDSAHREVDAALATVPPGAKLVWDLRDAPERTLDPILDRILDRIAARFARAAVVARTTDAPASDRVRVFADEDRAFDYVLGD